MPMACHWLEKAKYRCFEWVSFINAKILMGSLMLPEQEAHLEGALMSLLSLVHVGVTFSLPYYFPPSACHNAANKQSLLVFE